jgi:hypothetical protein
MNFENLTFLMLSNFWISLLCTSFFSVWLILAHSSVSTPNSFLFMQFPFWQSKHLQLIEHSRPNWKHSQYFFRQFENRHLHPLEMSMTTLLRSLFRFSRFSSWFVRYFGSKAVGFFCLIPVITLTLFGLSSLFWQSLQLQSTQNVSFRKHSQ